MSHTPQSRSPHTGTPQPRTTQSRILSVAGSAALSSAVGMIPLHRLPQPVRCAYIVLPAAAGAGAVVAALRRTPSRPAQTGTETGEARRAARRQITRAALPLVVGGLTAAAGAASISVDRGIENSLRRRGVRAPRLVMAIASGALSLGIDALIARSESRAAAEQGAAPAEEGAEPTSPPSAR